VERLDPVGLRGIIEALASDVNLVQAVRGGHLERLLQVRNGVSHSRWRLHTDSNVDRQPTRIAQTPGSKRGHHDQGNRLPTASVAEHCYVMDRWFAQSTLRNDLVAAKSSYVCRVGGNARLDNLTRWAKIAEMLDPINERRFPRPGK
jgi:hypothetical protein